MHLSFHERFLREPPLSSMSAINPGAMLMVRASVCGTVYGRISYDAILSPSSWKRYREGHPPQPTRAQCRFATHPDAHAACSAPHVLFPAGELGSCLTLSVASLAWSLRYFLRPPCSPPSESFRLPSPTSHPNQQWPSH